MAVAVRFVVDDTSTVPTSHTSAYVLILTLSMYRCLTLTLPAIRAAGGSSCYATHQTYATGS